jgi:hypothetical protein
MERLAENISGGCEKLRGTLWRREGNYCKAWGEVNSFLIGDGDGLEMRGVSGYFDGRAGVAEWQTLRT